MRSGIAATGRGGRVVGLGLGEEESGARGSPATGILSSSYRDNKWDKWSVTRLTTERKWGKEIRLAPSEGHSPTYVLLQKHVMSS